MHKFKKKTQNMIMIFADFNDLDIIKKNFEKRNKTSLNMLDLCH